MAPYDSFAGLLDYPGPHLAAALNRCLAESGAGHAAAQAHLSAFAREFEALGERKLQEIYTDAFDMQPETTLNTGYHLFGDDYKRSLFLVQLSELFCAQSFATGSELPDHACLVLRFLGRPECGAEAEGLAEDCLAPALTKIAARLEAAGNPYRHVVQALLAILPPPSVVPETAHPALQVLG